MASNPPTLPSKDPRDDAFIREVDEAYREDVMKGFLATWGRWVLLGVLVGLAALGGWFWWQADQKKKVDALSEQFAAALTKAESGGTTEAVADLAKIGESGNPAYRGLAGMTAAGIALNGGDTDKAIAELKRVIADPRLPADLKDVATLKLLRLEFDRIPPAEVLKRVDPYLKGDSPWFPIAGEMAALAHLKAGAPDKAGPLFYRIAADDRSPMSLRARAEQMAAAMGQDVTRISAEREARAKADAEGAAAPAAEAATTAPAAEAATTAPAAEGAAK